MLGCLETEACVCARDDDGAAGEAGRWHRGHLQELAIEELIEFGEPEHGFEAVGRMGDG